MEMSAELLAVLADWGPVGAVLVAIWFFVQYVKTRDSADAAKDALFIQVLEQRDRAMTAALDKLDTTNERQWEVLNKINTNVTLLNERLTNNHNVFSKVINHD